MSDPKAFIVTSPCGRAWEVPIEAVREDYAQFLCQVDGISLDEANAQVQAEEVAFWFYEQFQWSDIDRTGKLVKDASPETVKLALDLMRERHGGRDVDEVPHG